MDNPTAHQAVSWALREAEERILSHLQWDDQGPQWEPAWDDAGNPNVPSTERELLVFLMGDRSPTAYRPDDAGWGLRLGHWDTDKHCWRVNGVPCSYVTHWMECPPSPDAGDA